MSKELAVLTQVKNTQSFNLGNIKKIRNYDVGARHAVGQFKIDASFYYDVSGTTLTKYDYATRTQQWTLVPSTVFALADTFGTFVRHTDGFIYGIAFDTASPYTRQFFKVNESNGAVTTIGSTWTASGSNGRNFDLAVIRNGFFYGAEKTSVNDVISVYKIDISTGAKTDLVTNRDIGIVNANIYFIDDSTFLAISAKTQVYHLTYSDTVSVVAGNVVVVPFDILPNTIIFMSSDSQIVLSTATVDASELDTIMAQYVTLAKGV